MKVHNQKERWNRCAWQCAIDKLAAPFVAGFNRPAPRCARQLRSIKARRSAQRTLSGASQFSITPDVKISRRCTCIGPDGAKDCATGEGVRRRSRGDAEPVVGHVFLENRPGWSGGNVMPGTYSQILLHVVFSTRQRAAMIKPEFQTRLYEYIGGIVRSEGGTLLAIGGMPDHIHLLLRWRTDKAVAELLRSVKSRSSLWIHNTFAHSAVFAWQEGYAVFSVSKSAESDVKRYIERQAEHHGQRDFRAELLAFLRAHAVEFEERFVFD